MNTSVTMVIKLETHTSRFVLEVHKDGSTGGAWFCQTAELLVPVHVITHLLTGQSRTISHKAGLRSSWVSEPPDTRWVSEPAGSQNQLTHTVGLRTSAGWSP